MGTQIGKLIIDSRHEIAYSDLQGKKIGIDAYNMIYAFLAPIRTKETGGAYLLVRIGGGEPDLEPGLPDFLLEPSPADAWVPRDDLSQDGLIVVRDLVAELDGIFEVAGEPGYGGVIHLYLPLHRPEPVNRLEPSE